METNPILHICPLNLVTKIPRSVSNKHPTFLQYGKHSKFGSIFGISLSNLSTSLSNFCNIVPHYLHAKLTELGDEDLSSQVLTPYKISKVRQYDFSTEDLSVNPKDVKLSSN